MFAREESSPRAERGTGAVCYRVCHEPIQHRLGCPTREPQFRLFFSSLGSNFTWVYSHLIHPRNKPPVGSCCSPGLSCPSLAFFTPNSSRASCWTPGPLHPGSFHRGSHSSPPLFSGHQPVSTGDRALSFTIVSLRQNGTRHLESPDHDT